MKIGYFVTIFPYKDHFNDIQFFERYKYGGAETVAYYLAYNMAQRGHEIKVFTTSVDSKDVIEEYDNIKIYRYGSKFKIEKRNVPHKLFQRPLNYPMDIIHAHSSIPIAVFAAIRCANKKNIPFVFTYHGDSQESFGSLVRRMGVSFYNKYILDKVLSLADVIVSPSEYFIDESRFLGKYRDKIVVIPNGITIDEFDVPYSKEECREKLGLPPDDEIILFLGGLSPPKGPDILLKAMPKILKNIPDARLIFVGGGGMREELEILCEKLGVEGDVKFTGFVEESLKPFYYRAANVFCLPSVMKHEIFGIVNLEAMACGVPIVASQIGGVPDVVKDGENGLLVPPRDSKILADAIIYLLENKDIREKMGNNGRRKVEGYSWERIAEETEKVYEMVMNNE